MITIQRIEDRKKLFRLFVDERQLDAQGEYSEFERGTPVLDASDSEIQNLLSSCTFSDLAQMPARISISNFPDIVRLWDDVTFRSNIVIVRDRISDEHHNKKQSNSLLSGPSYRLKFDITGLPSRWRYPWTTTEYRRQFEELLKESNHEGVSWPTVDKDSEIVADMMPSISVSFIVQDPSNQIAPEIDLRSEFLKQIHKQTETMLRMRLPVDSIVAYFDFPQEVTVACEQYLLYFAQFMRDLGIETNTSITREAGQVLFTVVPNDKQHALDNIRAALDIFLILPSGSLTDGANEEIAIQRLEANILRLRSDLKLAAAELQAKNATIQAQQLTIDIQKGLLSGGIILDSMKNVTPKAEDKALLLGGVVALATFKEKGLEVNLGELFRKLKKIFSKE